MSDKGKVVGHKTFDDGRGGFRHEPLYEAEANAMLAAARKAKEARNAAIPDARTALNVLFDAYTRLKDMGWQDAKYAPADRSPMELIEVGSTGIHRGYRDEERRFWIVDTDVWPSSPSLWRPVSPSPDTERPAR